MKLQESISPPNFYITSGSLFSSVGSKHVKLFYSSSYLSIYLSICIRNPKSKYHFLLVPHSLPPLPTLLHPDMTPSLLYSAILSRD